VRVRLPDRRMKQPDRRDEYRRLLQAGSKCRSAPIANTQFHVLDGGQQAAPMGFLELYIGVRGWREDT